LKRFHFRLEQVLRVRRLQEDIARGALMHANLQARQAADAVNARVEEYATAARPSGPQSYDTFNRMQSQLDHAAGAITVARVEYQQALGVVEERRAEWAAARQRVAALERLEARRRDEHAIEVRRAEDRLVDDLVVARHARGAHV
jgi:flagellar protein FliJ